MNIKKFLLPIGSLFLITPLFAQSCLPHQIDNTNENVADDNKGKVEISTDIPDILGWDVSKLKKEIKAIKEKLKTTIEYSNLKQWNDFYSKNDNIEQKSRIWEPEFENESNYKHQDPGFKYFNNFLHTNNNISGTPSIYQADQRSFLFERWYLFYLKAVKEWKEDEIFDDEKVSLKKITEAIIKFLSPPPGSQHQDIINILRIIRDYSQSDPFNKLITINNDILMRQVEEGAKVPKIWSKYHETSNNILKATLDFKAKIIEQIFTGGSDGDKTPEGFDDALEIFKKVVANIFKFLPAKKIEEKDFYNKSINNLHQFK